MVHGVLQLHGLCLNSLIVDLNLLIMDFFKTPENSKEYFTVATFRLFIFFVLLFALFRFTGVWVEQEATLLSTTGALIGYIYVVYLIKRRKERKARETSSST